MLNLEGTSRIQVRATALWELYPAFFWQKYVCHKYSKLRKVYELRTNTNVMLENGNVNLTGHF